jgi:hypothetical protein
VVEVGETVLLPLAGTVPIPLSILTEVAPSMLQLKVAELPVVIVDGLTLKELITGEPAIDIATCVIAVTLVPSKPVAVSV